LRPHCAPRRSRLSIIDRYNAPHQASGAVERYGVHAVVANLLHTRKDRVLIVHGESAQQQSGAAAAAATAAPAASTAAAGGLVVDDVQRPAEEPHIEHILVAKVIELHDTFRKQQRS